MPGSGALQFHKNRISTHRSILQYKMPHPTLFDDFNGTLNTGLWTATDTAGGGGSNVAFSYSLAAGKPVAAHGGWLRGSTSDNAAGVEELAGVAVQWLPSQCGQGALIFETRVTFPSVSAINCSMGFNAAVTTGNLTMMSISGTTVLVTTAANAAGWIFDTRGTTDIFYGVSVSNGTDSAANTTAAVQGFAPSADKSYILRVEMDSSGNAFFYYGTADADQVSVGAGRAAAGDATLKATLLTPYIGVDNAAVGAVKSLDVDYIFVSAPRV